MMLWLMYGEFWSNISSTMSSLVWTDRSKRNKGNTINIKPRTTRNPSPHFPSKFPINLNTQSQWSSRSSITSQIIGKRRRNRKAISKKRSRQEIALLLALVKRRDRRVHCYLLAIVSGIHLEVIIVNSNFLIWVFGEEGELNGGVDVRAREIELVDVKLFERELRLWRMKDEPEEKDEKQKYGETWRDYAKELLVVPFYVKYSFLGSTVFWGIYSDYRHSAEDEGRDWYWNWMKEVGMGFIL